MLNNFRPPIMPLSYLSRFHSFDCALVKALEEADMQHQSQMLEAADTIASEHAINLQVRGLCLAISGL